MKTLYDIGNTVFHAQTRIDKEIQYDIFKKGLTSVLKDKDDEMIEEFFQTIADNGNVSLNNLAEEALAEVITKINVNHMRGDFISELFTIPLILVNNNSQINMVALNKIETFLKERALDYGLMSNDMDLILSPVILSQNKSKNMLFSEWYDLHLQTLRFMTKRDLRGIFQNDFTLSNPENIPVVVYIVGSILRKDNGSTPLFIENNSLARESKSDLIQDLQLFFNNHLDYNVLPLMVSPLFQGLELGYKGIQEILAEYFVATYSENEDIAFIVSPTNWNDNLILVAWEAEKNSIENYFIINTFKEEPADYLKMITEILNKLEVVSYLAPNIINFDSLDDFNDFDMKTYLDENELVMLSSPEYIDN